MYSSGFKLCKKPPILMSLIFLFSIVRCWLMGVKINRRYFELDFYHKKEFFIILHSCHMKIIRKKKTKKDV